MLCLLGGGDGHLVVAPCLCRVGKIGMQPGGQPGDLGDGRRQAGALLAVRLACQVKRKGEMGGDGPGKYPGRRTLFELAVVERGCYEQPLVTHVAVRDGSGGKDTE